MRNIDRSEAATQGREALEIMARGEAPPPSVEYPPGAPIDRGDRSLADPPKIRVENTTALDAARAFAARGIEPLILNFASAKHPGGGFLSGARAQEESLARSSSLYRAIEGCAMYAHHQRLHDPLYTSWMIYSPGVTVFRDDVSGALLDVPYRAAFITAPAPNTKVVLDRRPDRKDDVRAAIEERVDKVLAIACAHGHRELVLGAWGCGVFGNDPSLVSAIFARAIEVPYRGAFAEIVFAVTDHWDDQRNIGPFRRTFTSTNFTSTNFTSTDG